jgi:hypothetical protein
MAQLNEDKSRYKISDSHRDQPFVGVMKRDRETYNWTWKGHIDFVDGYFFEFASQRIFDTAVEAEAYMRRFACNHIDNRLNAR